MALPSHHINVFLATLFIFNVATANTNAQPDIVVVIADDLGWNDVSFHGSDQIPTPNIDALGYDGVILSQYYANPMCTPTRSALLTGKYASAMAMQGYPLTNSEDRGIPLNEHLLPEYLQALGYSTYAVGKWHVGRSRPAYLPTQRGFDSHFGYLGGNVDYYEYIYQENWAESSVPGYDMYRNTTVAWDVEGYLPDVLADEAVKVIHHQATDKPLFLYFSTVAPHAAEEGQLLQASPEAVRAHRHIADVNRRRYAAMVTSLDQSVGRIVGALSATNRLENSIIIFMSDNGGPTVGSTMNWSVNWPQRGIKSSPWQGGVRVPALIWSPKIKHNQHMWPGLMHVCDWLPTLVNAAGHNNKEANLKLTNAEINGVDQWKAITENGPSARTDILLDMDQTYTSYINGRYKLIYGNLTEKYNGYYGREYLRNIAKSLDYRKLLESNYVVKELQKINRYINIDNSLNLRQSLSINSVPPVNFPEPGWYVLRCLFSLHKLCFCQFTKYNGYYGREYHRNIAKPLDYRKLLDSNYVVKELQKIKRYINIDNSLNLRQSLLINSVPPVNFPEPDFYNLFDIISDPCETTNLAVVKADLVNQFINTIKKNYSWQTRYRNLTIFRDPASDPVLFNNTWSPWLPDLLP